MKILFCCEFFAPSVGGVQEVMRHLAIRMVAAGHEVTVATTALESRHSDNYCGITIKSFAVAGNLVNGMTGEVDAYRQFLLNADFDLLFVYAAQQWTFDALWDVLPELKMRKVMVPCGYSGLKNPAYQSYFEKLPQILAKFDAIVYHAKNYRDYEFGRKFGLDDRAVVIPNGADDKEFLVQPDPGFRDRMGISEDAFLLLTVGTLTGAKGHLEVALAFEHLELHGKSAVLLLNGNQIPSHAGGRSLIERMRKVARFIKTNRLVQIVRTTAKVSLSLFGIRLGYFAKLDKCIQRINYKPDRKVILCDLLRPDLVQAYLASDLFVFASYIEYSPLVLYEACAAGLPFLSVSAGNAEEIAEWTGGGEIIQVAQNHQGLTKVSPEILAQAIERLLADSTKCKALGESGRASWETRFNWTALAKEYMQLFERVCAGDRI